MRSLVLDAPRTLTWHDVPEPDLQDDGQALVRPLAVATCDLDHPMVAGVLPFPLPIAIGHECVAEVVETGRAVRSVRAGDRVVVPFQVSCGTCDTCRRGQSGDCERVPWLSTYGFGAFGHDHGGFLSDLVRVPFADAMLVKVPEGPAPADVASASDNLPDAWRLVAPYLAQWPGAEVLVVGGAGSIALYAVDLARALGAARVVYADTDAGRQAVAADLGAEVLERDPEQHKLGRFPITADFSGDPAGLRQALRSTAPGGHCTAAVPIFGPDVPLPMLELYTTGLHVHTGRAHARPAIPAILDLAAAGRIAPERVTTDVVPWEDAPQELARPRTKLVMARG
jgi:threonine dehydrogenase-like Zn-dependent dehydrogenase